MLFRVACGLFIIDKVVDGGMIATDSARRTLLHVDGTELHGLGIEGPMERLSACNMQKDSWKTSRIKLEMPWACM